MRGKTMIELIINKEKTLENILLAENGKLLEAYTSDKEDKKRRLEGNIYVGFVGDIIKGMQVQGSRASWYGSQSGRRFPPWGCQGT